MSESRRNKAGLHKKISSIFKGVPVQKKEGLEQTSEAPEPKSASYTEPEPPSTESVEPRALEKEEFRSMELQGPKPKKSLDVEPDKSIAPEPQEPQTSEPQGQEPKKSLDVESDKSIAPEPQEPQTLEPQEPKKSLVLKLDESNTPEPPEPQLSEPKKSLVLEPDESNAPEPPESPVLGLQESQTSNLQKTQAPKSGKSTQSLPKAAPAQEPKSDIGDIEKIVLRKSSSGKAGIQSYWKGITNKLFSPKPGVGPARQKAMVIMIPLLFIALIFLLRGVFGTTVPKTEAVEENTASRVAADSDSEIDWKIPEVYPATLRDPMRLGPLVTDRPENKTETKKVVKLTVQGILYAEDNPSAVVNNRIVHEGEIIRGATVIKISRDSVEFEMDGKRWSRKVR